MKDKLYYLLTTIGIIALIIISVLMVGLLKAWQ